MVSKRAKFFMFGKDDRCEEVRKFIEDAGILLIIRDLKVDPLSLKEIHNLVGYLFIEHFVDKTSPYYAKSGIEEVINDRDKVIEIIIKEQSLIKVPIVQSARLITIGCDKEKISNMLRIDSHNINGEHINDSAGNTRISNRPITKPRNIRRKRTVSSK